MQHDAAEHYRQGCEHLQYAQHLYENNVDVASGALAAQIAQAHFTAATVAANLPASSSTPAPDASNHPLHERWRLEPAAGRGCLNRGDPQACPIASCGGPALRHEDGAVWCSDTGILLAPGAS